MHGGAIARWALLRCFFKLYASLILKFVEYVRLLIGTGVCETRRVQCNCIII